MTEPIITAPHIPEAEGIFVAILYGDKVDGYFFDCMNGLYRWMVSEALDGRQTPVREVFTLRSGPALAGSRNMAVNAFLETRCKRIMFIDADQVFEPAIFASMYLTAEEHGLEVLAGISTVVTGPWPSPRTVALNIYERDEGSGYYMPVRQMPPPHKLVQVDAVGAACVMIDREVFHKVSALPTTDNKWFHHRLRPDGDQYGEDISFCDRLRDAGVPIHVHTDLVFPHAKVTLIDPRDIIPNTDKEDGQVPSMLDHPRNPLPQDLSEKELALLARGVKGGSDDDPADDLPPLGDEQTFPRSYVEELRQEAAANRVKAREYEAQVEALQPYAEVFSGYEPETQQQWAAIMQLNKVDPERARDMLAEAFDLTPAQAAAAADSLEDDWDPEDIVTKGDLAQLQQELRTSQEEREAATLNEQILRAAEELGYERETKAMSYLLMTAATETNGDIDAAHSRVLEEREAALDEERARLLEERTKDVRDSALLPPSDAAGTPASQEEAPRDFKMSKASALERIRASMASEG